MADKKFKDLINKMFADLVPNALNKPDMYEEEEIVKNSSVKKMLGDKHHPSLMIAFCKPHTDKDGITRAFVRGDVSGILVKKPDCNLHICLYNVKVNEPAELIGISPDLCLDLLPDSPGGIITLPKHESMELVQLITPIICTNVDKLKNDVLPGNVLLIVGESLVTDNTYVMTGKEIKKLFGE